MSTLRIRTATGQLAEYLKDEIRAGRWTDRMPGESWLMTHLQVGRGTVRGAMAQLEEEGVLVSHGQGKWRRIAMSRGADKDRNLRVRILLYEKHGRGDIDNSSLLAELLDAGFDAGFAAKSLKDPGMDVGRVARHVNQNPADAWVVSAASREVLAWFAGQPFAALAMYGRHKGIPMAAAYPAMIPGQTEAVRHLIHLGHKRIVMLTRGERRKPHLSRPERAFIEQLMDRLVGEDPSFASLGYGGQVPALPDGCEARVEAASCRFTSAPKHLRPPRHPRATGSGNARVPYADHAPKAARCRFYSSLLGFPTGARIGEEPEPLGARGGLWARTPTLPVSACGVRAGRAHRGRTAWRARARGWR